MDISRHIDEEGIVESEKLVLELIEEQINLGFNYNQIILAGFSQGGAMSIHVGTRLDKKIAGIIALSSYLPIPKQINSSKSVNKNTPIFMGHGTQDPVVPYSLGKLSCDTLINAGYNVDWNSYPLQHGVSMEELADIKQWLIKNIKT